MTVKILKSGAIVLGDSVTCDGFSVDCPVRVQTHIHSDHLVDFNTSKANQTIVCTPSTRDLLCAMYNADLPYRNNLLPQDYGVSAEYGDVRVTLHRNNHMLGSAQVCVETTDGQRVGYSSDFFWPIETVIEVDELLIDPTYGNPEYVRSFRQADVDERLVEVVQLGLQAGRRVAVIGYNGRLQSAMLLLADQVRVPTVASPKAHALVGAYRSHGFPIRGCASTQSAEGAALLQSDSGLLAFLTPTEVRHLPWIGGMSKVSLSCYRMPREEPVLDYGNGDWRVAYTDHTDLEGTLEYISQTGAEVVYTDSASPNGVALAETVRNRLGVRAIVLERQCSNAWGGG